VSGRLWRVLLSAVVAAAVAVAVCMSLFRGLGWSWMPQALSDQWTISGVFAVVVSGAVTAWVMREPDSPSGGEPEPGGQSFATTDGHAEPESGATEAAAPAETSTVAGGVQNTIRDGVFFGPVVQGNHIIVAGPGRSAAAEPGQPE
jgi:hypothetical protein